ncbi:MAG: helix-hairpin-helix domain-containing protein [Candidatus Thiodiazotropha sp. DIVDIV]
MGKDPYKIYSDLCKVTHTHHDPCVIDVLFLR